MHYDKVFVEAMGAGTAYLGGCILVPNEAAYRIAFAGVDFQTAADSYGVSAEMIKVQVKDEWCSQACWTFRLIRSFHQDN